MNKGQRLKIDRRGGGIQLLGRSKIENKAKTMSKASQLSWQCNWDIKQLKLFCNWCIEQVKLFDFSAGRHNCYCCNLRKEKTCFIRWYFYNWHFIFLLMYSWYTMMCFWYTAKWFKYTCVFILFHILFHYSLLQDTEYSSLCYI